MKRLLLLFALLPLAASAQFTGVKFNGGNPNAAFTLNVGNGTPYKNPGSGAINGETIKSAADDYDLTLLQQNSNAAGWGFKPDNSTGNLFITRYVSGAYSATPSIIISAAGNTLNGVTTAAAGQVGKVSVLTTSTTIDNTYHTVIANSASAITITLPATPADGQEYPLKNWGAGTLTIAGNGHNIDGASTSTMAQFAHQMVTYSVTLTAWIIGN